MMAGGCARQAVGAHRFLAADDGGQFLLHHADQGLAGGEAGDHVLAQCLFLDAGDELADHRQRHVGFQQGEADFAQHFGGVRLGQAGLAAHGLDDPRQALCEIVQHGRSGGGKWGFPVRRVAAYAPDH